MTFLSWNEPLIPPSPSLNAYYIPRLFPEEPCFYLNILTYMEFKAPKSVKIIILTLIAFAGVRTENGLFDAGIMRLVRDFASPCE